MRKVLLILILLTTGEFLFAQVGIGTDLPNPSSQLEIKSSNRGVLIPQIALSSKIDQNTITAGNLESLLIYNTSTNATLTPGYYYWFENKWHRILTDDSLPDYIVFWDVTNNHFTYIDENGNTQIINFPETLTILGLNADGHTLEYMDEDGVLTAIDLETIIKNFETLTAIVDNGDGTFTYTDEAGNTSTVDMSSLETLTYLALNADGKTLEYTDENGVISTINLETIIKNFETLTVMVNNGNGTFTYTDEAGNDTIIDMSSLKTLTYLALNTDGKTLEYTDENDVVSSIDLETVIKNFETITTLVDNADGTFTYTNEAGDTTIIEVSHLETLTSIALNPDNINIDYTDEAGSVTQLDLTQIVKNLETITTLVDNADGTFTYTNETGAITTIDVSNIETLTTLALNTDGRTLEYTDEAGDVTSIDLETIIQANQKTVTLVDGENTTISSDVVGNNSEYKINVPTATDRNLGVVKQAAVNPSVLIDSDGELSVALSNTNAIKEISSNYALGLDDAIILGNASAATVIISLPTANADNMGKKFTIKKQDDNESTYVKVTGNIDGLTELYTALPYSGWDLVSDGSQWRIVNKF